MTDYTRHQEGAFSWADLSTTDPDSAKSFYSTVFGWDITDEPAGDGVYSMARIKGRDVCAIQELRPDQRDAGMPPMWMAYFTVEDVDMKAKEIEVSSGMVHVPPFDVLEAGRMTVASDPTGAVFCLWQANDMIGAQITDEPNTLGWAEIATPNTGMASAFYTQVLGWVADDVDMGAGGTYTVFKLGDLSVAGMMGTQSAEQPAAWNVYFDVADCDATVELVRKNGGNILMDPDDIPDAGRVAFVTDPQGAAFGIIQPEA